MKTLDLAIVVLSASAVMLGVWLLSALGGPGADARAGSSLIREGALTAMTARTDPNGESLFILDNASQRLMIYGLDRTRNRWTVLRNLDLQQVFYPEQGGESSQDPVYR